MELLKKAFFENVDTVVATKSEVAYLKESVLVFNSGKKIAAPPKPYTNESPHNYEQKQ